MSGGDGFWHPLPAAGAVMETDTSTADMDFVIDEDDMASDSATKVPTQQSVKAYVDASMGGGGGGDRVWVPAGAMHTMAGASLVAVGSASQLTQAWGLDASAVEIVAVVMAMPTDWTTFDVDVVWMPTGAGGGNCRFRVDRQPINDGATANGRSFGTQVTIAGPAQYVVEVTRADSGVTCPTTAIRLQVERDASHVTDTMAGDMGVIGLLLTKAS